MITYNQYRILSTFIDHKSTRLRNAYILDLDKYKRITQQLIENGYIKRVTALSDDHRSYPAYQITPKGSEEYDRFYDQYGRLILLLKFLKFVGCDIIIPIIVSVITTCIIRGLY